MKGFAIETIREHNWNIGVSEGEEKSSFAISLQIHCTLDVTPLAEGEHKWKKDEKGKVINSVFVLKYLKTKSGKFQQKLFRSKIESLIMIINMHRIALWIIKRS